jgi:hypothetical protein
MTKSWQKHTINTAVIRNLEQKLCAKYQCDLAEHLQEKTKIEAKFLLQKSKLEANLVLAEGRTHEAKVRTQDILVQNAALMRENKSLQQENVSVLVATLVFSPR